MAKVVPERTFSVTLHPTSDRVLAATGDKWGKIGLWDVVRIYDDIGLETKCVCLWHKHFVSSIVFLCISVIKCISVRSRTELMQ